MHDRVLLSTTAAVAIAGLLAGCQSSTKDADASGTAPQPDAADLNDGGYRVEITEDEVEEAGLSNGPGWSGTWTLTLRDGTYQLTCKPLEPGGRDCGNSVSDEVLEAGNVEVDGDRVHFTYDPELMSQLTGCVLPVSSDPGRCYSIPPYAFTWTSDGDRLTLADAGSPEVPHALVLEPWQRIA